MIIGTVRLEEAKVFDQFAGYHSFHSEPEQIPHGSFEVFFDDVEGWSWWACFPGCIPEGDAFGGFASSRQALEDADEWNPEFDDDNAEGAK